MKLLGIDPGIAGGAGIIETAPLRVIDAISIPVVLEGPKRRVDARYFLDWLLTHRPEVGFIERAQAMPVRGRHGKEGEEEWQGQGASSAFLYGRATGYLEAIPLCAGVRMHLVEAAVWKRKAGLIIPGQKRTPAEVKEASRELVLDLFPKDTFLFQRKKDHGRAEAVLLARHGALHVLNRGTDEKAPQAEIEDQGPEAVAAG